MIKSVLIINNHGKPRLVKFYEYFEVEKQQQIIRETFSSIARRSDKNCNFLDAAGTCDVAWGNTKDTKIIYRHYATLYFIFCVDGSESELGIMDLIQVFVETLDKTFENVCELDLIFHMDKVHYVLDEIVMGGMVLETKMSEIFDAVDAQNKLEKSEDVFSGLKDVLNRVQR
eukprot:TRINITY_DN3888_c0_g1_i1.p1 TRINITY_DN3888_c0_g1~~TRINITY_DN3888_c0_g1_i1.p1  ORF type:complete len:181 (-),score=82.65 TRINITY_DN3888_c0_g1_i1:132-647(-)